MKLVTLLVVTAFLSAPVCAGAPVEKAGDEFRITVSHKAESKREGGSSSSSGGHEYIERILAVREEGVERVYDIPLEAGDEKRLTNWQFPVRVFESNDGKAEILNRVELEKRRDAWLEAAKIPAQACGTWYFTWNAFQVECDPDAILETVRAIRIQPALLADGALFAHPAALTPGRLNAVGPGNTTFRVDMPVNPDFFHRQKARSDVVVGEIMKEPIAFDEAYARRKTERITGTIEVVLQANANGQVWKQFTSLETVTTETGGASEREVSKETIERKQI